ncbi:V8-like Glu-specific endopeptidase [Kibdelosporangium banguiense]|uniref:V8-like Glu-specific endopeptidase n=1 Tax=Kibdelosporangium banguiense TaxID=1365924 RepID=A0ABS4U231_9PSEU|nr:trypsin-like serine protease [Kibdelosporangium banguiense]MBP2330719.1 V8-like Glu-specific endopeptidase [Kibdelosporangium banguiense]
MSKYSLRLKTLLAVAAVMLVAPPLASAAPAASDVTKAPEVGALSQAQAEQYWTPERMRKARPVRQDAKAAPVGPLDANPVLTPGGDQFGNAQVARPYTGDFKSRVTGKIFFLNPKDGLNYVCSGSVINSSGKSVVATAAHCVFQGGPAQHLWSQNLIFVPSYDNNARPLGTWSAATFWIPTTYFNHGNDGIVHEDDVASVAIQAQGASKITNVVGGLGWVSNNSGVINGFVTHGYPQERYGGQNQLRCVGNGRDANGANGVTFLFTNNCVAFGGWSGGPVINASNQLLAVVSGSDRSTNTFYARAASSTWIPVLNAAQAAGF